MIVDSHCHLDRLDFDKLDLNNSFYTDHTGLNYSVASTIVHLPVAQPLLAYQRPAGHKIIAHDESDLH